MDIEAAAPLSELEPIIIVSPSTPVGEMSDSEYDHWVDAVAAIAADRLHPVDHMG